jgi:hypothetical protein
MLSQHWQSLEQPQRLRVETESSETGSLVKIRLERYEEHLDWYTAGSLTIPLHQLPLLEQAIEALRVRQFAEKSAGEKILLFPGLANQSPE